MVVVVVVVWAEQGGGFLSGCTTSTCPLLDRSWSSGSGRSRGDTTILRLVSAVRVLRARALPRLRPAALTVVGLLVIVLSTFSSSIPLV